MNDTIEKYTQGREKLGSLANTGEHERYNREVHTGAGEAGQSGKHRRT